MEVTMDITRENLEKELEQGNYSDNQKELVRLMFETDTYEDMMRDKELISVMNYVLSPSPSAQKDVDTAVILSNIKNLHWAAGTNSDYYNLIEGYYDKDSNYSGFCTDSLVAIKIFDNVLSNSTTSNPETPPNPNPNVGTGSLIGAAAGANHIKDNADKYQTSKGDPLIIDLDKNGFTATTAEEGAYFNLDSNGFAEKTAWTTEAFLAMDKNGNGTIDDGSELFSDTMIKSDGTRAVDGFDALADLDENGDGIIDNNDSAFSKLLLWQDKNGDGIAASDELSTLAENGIISIDISNIKENGETINDDVVLEKSAIINFSDGSSTTIGEFMFGKNGYDTMEEKLEITDAEILALPNVKQIGNIPSLHHAMAADETGTIKALLNEFTTSDDMSQKEAIIESILTFLCNADSVTENYGVVDSKHLRVLEYVFGGEYDGVFNEHSGSSLEAIYKDVVDVYYNVINVQSCIKDWSDNAAKMPKRRLFNFISEEISNNPSNMYKLGEMARYLKFTSSNNDYSMLNSFV